jgi:hypothetical protein
MSAGPRTTLTAVLAVLAGALAAVAAGLIFSSAAHADSASRCQLNSAKGKIKHVIYVQFDNTHLVRDNPNVPSDLEQMPHLLNFLEGNGTVLNQHHTILISHTAGGILTSLTGLYPDRGGPTVTNSYDYYRADGTPTFTSAFKYWTAPVAAPADPTPNMVNGDSGSPRNTPAPWVTYTRAGCDVGDVSAANTVLENNNAVLINGGPTTLVGAAAAGDTSIKVASTSGLTTPGKAITIDSGANAESASIASTAAGGVINLAAPLTLSHAIGATVYGPTSTDPTGDMTTIFGAGSPEWNEGKASQTAPSGTAERTLAQTDFVGIAVHCGNGETSVCKNNSNARTDPLPDEPGGYNGFQALFGAKYVNPAIAGGGSVVNDVDGAPIGDRFGQPGFPGFDSMSASVTLGYVAQMQEAGIPVTYAYVSDAHDKFNAVPHESLGPGEPDYVKQLKGYDAAFAKFFDRLAAHGINKSNTLFVFTADEGDHVAADQAQGCDGVTTPCEYKHGVTDITDITSGATPPLWPAPGDTKPYLGEIGIDLKWLFGLSGPLSSGYDISFDSAPSFYINNQPQALDASGNVAVNPTLREFEKRAASVKAFDPYIDKTRLIPVSNYLADAPTLKALHMINADPQRTMSFTMFSQPDFFFQTFTPCGPSAIKACVNSAFSYIHGDYAPDVGQTWLGLVGPGVKANGLDNQVWSDHADIQPTIMALLGLKNDYAPDGRVIADPLSPSALPVALQENRGDLLRLGAAYKQLNAPYGEFARWLLLASTEGIRADDTTYLAIENKIKDLTSARDALATSIRAALNRAAFGGTAVNDDQAQAWIRQGGRLIDQAHTLAGP